MPLHFPLESHEFGAFFGGVFQHLVKLTYGELLRLGGAYDEGHRELTPSELLPLARQAVDNVISSFPEALRPRLENQRDELAAMLVGGGVH